MTSFESLTETFAKTWSNPFAIYFQQHFHEMIRNIAAFSLEKIGFPNAYEGITINASESFNNILKNVTERKEVAVDTLTLILHQLQLHYVHQYHRALRDEEGEWKMKSGHEKLCQPARLLESGYPSDPISLRDCIRGATRPNPIRLEKARPRESTLVLAESDIYNDQVPIPGDLLLYKN